jgi:hypothetical protein
MLLWSTLATHILSVIHTLFAFMYFTALVYTPRETILYAGDVAGKYFSSRSGECNEILKFLSNLKKLFPL